MKNPGSLSDGESLLFTDLYELNMAQSYFKNGMTGPATFSLVTRSSSANRSYFVASGLEDVINYLTNISPSTNTIDYLNSTGLFTRDFLHYIKNFNFTGTVRAIPEGRIFFPDEPLIEINAPIMEAQLVETLVMNQIHHQTVVATKAARCVWASKGKAISDFSMRRTHGIDAGMKSARASFMVGFESTSNVLAGKVYGIPITGTMAHSYVSSFENEIDAFRTFSKSLPGHTVLLIDTYDVVAGAEKAVVIAKEMEATGYKLKAVRIDSGDLKDLSIKVRKILNEGGLEYVQILASGGLDEFQIQELVEANSPIDGFGVGTRMGISADAPWLEMAYKLVKYDGRPVLKLSTGKVSLADEKQVLRSKDRNGNMLRDVIGIANEKPLDIKAEPLLETLVEKGTLKTDLPSLKSIRERFFEDFSSLGEEFKTLENPSTYPVLISNRLRDLQRGLQKNLAQT